MGKPSREPGPGEELSGEALAKEIARLIRLARSHWEAHENGACRAERDRALALYPGLTPEDKKRIPPALLVWLRYRSEKYFGEGRTPPGGQAKGGKAKGEPAKGKPAKGDKAPKPGR